MNTGPIAKLECRKSTYKTYLHQNPMTALVQNSRAYADEKGKWIQTRSHSGAIGQETCYFHIAITWEIAWKVFSRHNLENQCSTAGKRLPAVIIGEKLPLDWRPSAIRPTAVSEAHCT